MVPTFAHRQVSPTGTDYDLAQHQKHSGEDMQYFDQATGERYIPHVVEPSFGLTRALMAFLVESYTEDEAPNAKGGVDKRTVLKLDPRLAPVKAAVLPLSRNEKLSPVARELGADLRKYWNVDFDDADAGIIVGDDAPENFLVGGFGTIGIGPALTAAEIVAVRVPAVIDGFQVVQ